MNSCFESTDARCSLIQIVRYRFQAFEAKFNRQPGPHEPLFFDELEDWPVKADPDTTKRQLEEAAQASGVKLDPVLKFLGLAPVAGFAVILALEDFFGSIESVFSSVNSLLGA